MTRDTVAVETPATRATSRRPTLRLDAAGSGFVLFLPRMVLNWPAPIQCESDCIVADKCPAQFSRLWMPLCGAGHPSRRRPAGLSGNRAPQLRSEEAIRSEHQVAFAVRSRQSRLAVGHRARMTDRQRRDR